MIRVLMGFHLDDNNVGKNYSEFFYNFLVNELNKVNMTSCLEYSLKDTIFYCLKQQMSELELLKSMYPNPEDIVITDKEVFRDIQNFLDNKTDYTPNHLDFVINLLVNELKLEICVNLPSLYPNEEPDIYVRCNQLNRQQEKRLNTDLTEHMKSNYQTDVCLYTVISWLQENVDNFTIKTALDDKSQVDEEARAVEYKFVRYWIFSHHIYNKRKREDIVKKAKDLKLTGFCLPGKPGVICIEGMDSDCNEWWKDIKSMSWKKIGIRKTEVFEPSEQKNQQKFIKFEELHFQNAASRLNKHADMSGLSKYLEERGLMQAFNDLFGLCND